MPRFVVTGHQVGGQAGAQGRTMAFNLRLTADVKVSDVAFTVNTESVMVTPPATITVNTTLTNDHVWLAANSVRV